VGRVVRINFGTLEGKLATIVDILNDKRVLIDGESIQRQVIPIRRLQLTKHILKVGRGVRTGKLKAVLAKEKVQEQFENSALGKGYARQARREQLNDFERYKVLAIRRKISKLSKARPNKKPAASKK
jgi:large subunit ribosomal protein L14e